MGKLKFSIILVAMCFTALLEHDFVLAKEIRYKNAYDIPLVLKKRVETGLNYERYRESLVRQLISVTHKQDNFTHEDAETVRNEHIINAKYKKVESALLQEENFDGVITIHEMTNRLYLTRSQHIPKTDFTFRIAVKRKFEGMDHDRDGKITIEEMSHLDADELKEIDKDVNRTFGSFMRCDLNEDGTLTIKELENAIAAAFAFFDQDGDGKISRDEEKAATGK